MKSVLILVSVLLASFSCGVPLGKEITVTFLKAPERVGMTEIGPIDGVAFRFDWSEVVSDDPEDPVTGYSAYLWEIKKSKTMAMNYLTGQQEEVETKPEIDDEYLPDGIPMIATVPANQTYAYFRNLKLRVSYEIRVKAFTKTREGPFSRPTRHEILNKSQL